MMPENNPEPTGRERMARNWFKPGNRANPKGRPRGTPNKVTIDARQMANELVDSPEYRAALKARLLAGTAGPMEVLMMHYAKGKPVDRTESGGPGAFADVTTDELRQRLAKALDEL
jgi:hypothetical protein